MQSTNFRKPMGCANKLLGLIIATNQIVRTGRFRLGMKKCNPFFNQLHALKLYVKSAETN